MDPAQEFASFRSRHPGITAIDVILPDLCGVLRGKRVPVDDLAKIHREGVAFPGCTFAVDITGETIEATGLSLDLGVPDRPCFPVAGTLAEVPWSLRPLGQVLLAMRDADGAPFPYAPRSLVERLEGELGARGLTPVMAMELEFYLTAAADPPSPPISPLTGRPQPGTQVYGLDEMLAFEAVLDGITAAANAQGIPAGTAIAEYGPGQFEINLAHVPSALAAADHAVLFKRVVKSVAQQNGLEATFMAKPYSGHASSGLHVHMSVRDRDGANLFAADDPAGSAPLRWTLGGLAETLPAALALAAPGANSWRRLQAGAYTPTAVTWGVNNRTVPLRIPDGPAASRRVEYRIAGADANPYLVAAAMLTGLLEGLDRRPDPGPPVRGGAPPEGAPPLPATWEAALATFERSDAFRRRLGDRFVETWLQVKRAERDKFTRIVTPLELDWYRRTA